MKPYQTELTRLQQDLNHQEKELAEARQEIRRLSDQLTVVGSHAQKLEEQVSDLNQIIEALTANEL